MQIRESLILPSIEPTHDYVYRIFQDRRKSLEVLPQ